MDERKSLKQQYLEKSSLNCLIINLEGFKEAAEMSLNNINLTSVDEHLKIREVIDIIIEFAEDEIIMRQEFEKTMALLVFDKPLESPYGYLL
ncbi:unnamed protein product [Adineta steineri]|uniref:Uncharacterized protein n=1 Tax=Adineta steineri TaxID=433720 RepID=A0A815KZ82_9BILA|nr:unnamed protein product [Adineta steineri]CAF3717989.1 unnamed protein product [Adineta steineri]CAF4047253.1 unnamed protein product [Adineta steineri]